MLTEDQKEKWNSAMNDYPKRKGHVDDMRRLLDLAKKSNFAAANDDFLRRIEMDIERMEGDLKLFELMKEVMESKE